MGWQLYGSQAPCRAQGRLFILSPMFRDTREFLYREEQAALGGRENAMNSVQRLPPSAEHSASEEVTVRLPVPNPDRSMLQKQHHEMRSAPTTRSNMRL